MKCNICKRETKPYGECRADDLNMDCGGDCWGCVGAIELESEILDSRYFLTVVSILSNEKSVEIRDARKWLPRMCGFADSQVRAVLLFSRLAIERRQICSSTCFSSTA